MYPGPPPPGPDDPAPRHDDPRRYPDDRDIRLPRYRGDDADTTLTTGDIVLCVLCSGIACIMGIVYAVQGKPKAVKMILLALVFSVVWTGVRVLLLGPQR